MNTLLWSPQALALLAGLVAVGALNAWLKRINQFFFFSRTVPAGFAVSPQAGKITSDYMRGVWLGCVAGVGVAACMVQTTRFSLYLCFTSGLVLQCIYTCLAFARAHRLTGLALASMDAQAVHDSAEVAPTVSVPLLDPSTITRAVVLQMVLAPICALLAWLVPMALVHQGFAAFSKSMDAHGGDFLSGLGLGLLAGSVLLFVQLKYFSRHRSRLAHFTVQNCVMLAWFGAVVTAIGSLSVLLDWTITAPQRRIILGVVLGVAVLRMVYAWMRARQFAPPQVERGGDEFWRWGLFYYNPGDPTLFIQHRAGPGYTVNFANFLSWPLTLAVLADFVFLICIHPYR